MKSLRSWTRSFPLQTKLSRLLDSRPSEPTRHNPETLAPRPADRNALQLLIGSSVRQIECIGDGRHRLEADKVLARRRIDDGHRVFRTVDQRDLAATAFHPELRAVIF